MVYCFEALSLALWPFCLFEIKYDHIWTRGEEGQGVWWVISQSNHSWLARLAIYITVKNELLMLVSEKQALNAVVRAVTPS